MTKQPTIPYEPANLDVDPVQHALDLFGGDDRAAIAALISALFETRDEVDRLRRALSVANAATSFGYDRGHKGALVPPI
ncbi:hypothetical protein [Aureimonas glaciei]|uniref:Uncharacterized protein n=1 Tax=Aureimonas glaciei TaxID=1776957 RepID=A0A917DBM1_9HYPH|nr:hypothetical protein [Aureimonas glaciei]GGD24203.1 hypothetical protein GCM10011335_28920 [Aureimonas glaciei]